MQNKSLMSALIVGLALVLIIGSWFALQNDDLILVDEAPPVVTETVTEPAPFATPLAEDETEPSPQPEPVEVIEEPVDALPPIIATPLTLEQSDARVLLAVADFSPKLAQWLLPEEQLRKWVLAVDLMADGKLPKRYRPLDYPMARFVVTQQGLETVANKDNMLRMSTIIKTVTSIDPKILARYYHQWLPILEAAYSEQGKPDTFDQRFRQTISRILGAEPLSEIDNIALSRPSVLYRYTDPNLEQASDVEKLLWRMGPDNSEQLQYFLRELRYELEQ